MVCKNDVHVSYHNKSLIFDIGENILLEDVFFIKKMLLSPLIFRGLDIHINENFLEYLENIGADLSTFSISLSKDKKIHPKNLRFPTLEDNNLTLFYGYEEEPSYDDGETDFDLIPDFVAEAGLPFNTSYLGKMMLYLLSERILEPKLGITETNSFISLFDTLEAHGYQKEAFYFNIKHINSIE